MTPIDTYDIIDYEVKIMKKNISIILTMIMMLSICSAVSYASGYEPSSWAVESIDFAHKHDLISDESSEKKRYTSVMCFRNEEEMKAYKATDHNQMITLFHDAKRPQEYL